MSIVSIWEQIVAVNIWQQWQSQQQRWWDDTITIKAKFKTYGTSLFSADFLLLELQECMEKRDVEKRLNYVISFHFIFFCSYAICCCWISNYYFKLLVILILLCDPFRRSITSPCELPSVFYTIIKL